LDQTPFAAAAAGIGVVAAGPHIDWIVGYRTPPPSLSPQMEVQIVAAVVCTEPGMAETPAVAAGARSTQRIGFGGACSDGGRWRRWGEEAGRMGRKSDIRKMK